LCIANISEAQAIMDFVDVPLGIKRDILLQFVNKILKVNFMLAATQISS